MEPGLVPHCPALSRSSPQLQTVQSSTVPRIIIPSLLTSSHIINTIITGSSSSLTTSEPASILPRSPNPEREGFFTGYYVSVYLVDRIAFVFPFSHLLSHFRAFIGRTKADHHGLYRRVSLNHNQSYRTALARPIISPIVPIATCWPQLLFFFFFFF
ncbi:hypothetical protein F5B20DRAFT_563050, partial [Whalleya microplaca]